MFEPPVEHCSVCGEFVALAQTPTDCARRQACGEDAGCPLRRAFTTTDFYLAGAQPPKPDPA